MIVLVGHNSGSTWILYCADEKTLIYKMHLHGNHGQRIIKYDTNVSSHG